MSVFARAGAETWVYLSDNTVANATGYVDVANCVVGTKGAGGIDIFADDYGNGICRAGLSFTGTAAAHTFQFSAADGDGDNTTAGGDGSTVTFSLHGMHLEQTDRLQSYLATTTAAVTRANDVLTYSATGNADRLGGALVVDWVADNYDNASLSRRLACVGTSTTDLVDITLIGAGDALNGNVVSGNVSQAGTTSGLGDAADGQRHVVAHRWGTNLSRLTEDGTVGTADTSVTVPASFTSIFVGHYCNSTLQIGQPIQSVKIYGPAGIGRLE